MKINSLIASGLITVLFLILIAISCTPESLDSQITGVFLNKNELRLTKGESMKLLLYDLPSRTTLYKGIDWKSSNNDVASVRGGIVQCLSAGFAEITAEYEGFIDKCSVTVTSPASEIHLDKKEIEMRPNEQAVLTATVIPEDTTDDISWYSYNESVASVTNGIVYSHESGEAEILVKAGDKTDKCIIRVIIPVESISFKSTYMELTPLSTATIDFEVTPYNATTVIEWESSDTSIAIVENGAITAGTEGTATITASADSFTAACVILVKQPIVDLGLSVKWSTCNLGASSPEQRGEIYAWGETEARRDFTWYTYKWGNGEEGHLTKYVLDSKSGKVDNKYRLDKEDDVAIVKLGGKWRLPTAEEANELLNSCSWNWVSYEDPYQFMGKKYIHGALGTSNINGNTIFFPAVGWVTYVQWHSYDDDCMYWCSDLKNTFDDYNSRNAYSLNFREHPYYTMLGGYDVSTFARYVGLPVRPVVE